MRKYKVPVDTVIIHVKENGWYVTVRNKYGYNKEYVYTSLEEMLFSIGVILIDNAKN